MRLILADDAALLREALARALAELGFDVCGQAGDAEELLRLVAADPPDVAIVDIRMPPTNTDEGLRAAAMIRSQYPQTAVLVLSQYVEVEYAVKLLSSETKGVGYLLKDRITNLEELREAIHRVAAGESVIDPEVVALLVSRPRRSSPLDRLSDRERDVLASMAEGRSNQAIAERLSLSERTVESYVGSVFLKLSLPQSADENRRVLAVLTYLRSPDTPTVHVPAETTTAGRVARSFMFTDIVDSTKLMEAIGDDAWSDLQRWHDATIRRLIVSHGGREVKQTGDGFFAVFDDTAGSLRCAMAMQQALATHRREHGFAPSIRVGVHRAEALSIDDDFTGRGVVEARRIADSAAAGEIVTSAPTVAGVAERFEICDPRSVSLKGIADPVEVVTLVWR